MPLPTTLPIEYNSSSDNKNTKCFTGLQRYEIVKKIGSGNFGSALLVKDRKKDVSASEAYKVLKQICVGVVDPGETIDAMQEAKLLSKLKHASIVQFFESFVDGQFFCISLEYCEGGDLEDAINIQKGIEQSFEELKITSWFKQLLDGVIYMHAKRILHRDLKTRNIFLKNNKIKIGDFGISKILMGTYDKANTFVGTPYYMSPEVLNHEDYDEKCDIWSLGIVLYRMCTFKYPFDGSSLMNIMLKIVSDEMPTIGKHYSESLDNLVQQMFCRSSTNRPTALEISQHRLFTSYASESIKESKSLSARDRIRLKKQKEADEKMEKLKNLARQKLKDNKRNYRKSKESRSKTSIFTNDEIKNKELDFFTMNGLAEYENTNSKTIVFDESKSLNSSSKKVMIPTVSQTYVKTDMGDSLNSFVDDDEIPEDAEMAETLYFLEGFESGGDDVTSSTSSTDSIEETITNFENSDLIGSLSSSSLQDYDEMIENLHEALESNEETQVIKKFDESKKDYGKSSSVNKNYTTSLKKINQNPSKKLNKISKGFSQTHNPSRYEDSHPNVERGFPNTVSFNSLKENNETQINNTQKPMLSSMGMSVMTQKIENMRDKCKSLLGNEKFLQAYDIITKIRFDGDAAASNLKILKSLEKIIPDTSKCMLLEELVFLEQEKFRSTLTNKEAIIN